MTIKYSKFYIGTTIRTILLMLDDFFKNLGNNIEKNYSFNLYLKTSQLINNLYLNAKRENMDEFELVAINILSNECQMTNEEISINKKYIKEISDFFKDIINIDYKYL